MASKRRSSTKISPRATKSNAAKGKRVSPRAASSSRRTTSKKRAAKKTPRSFFRRLLVWMFVLAIWLGIGMLVLVAYYAHDLPSVNNIDKISKRPSVIILAHDGATVANYGDLYGEYLRYDDFPPSLIQALLATEDRRFFQHFGIDPIGLVRAFYRNMQAGRVVEGGSTITQQLAKNLFLSPERTLKRKAQEVLLALWLEYRFSKEAILTLYLNRVYLGSGTYGVDAAARRYFNKSARLLNLSEAALVVGLLKAPSRYSPVNNPELSLARAHQVLRNMHNAGFITDDMVALAMNFPAQVNSYSGGSRGSYYFADWLLEQLPNHLGRIDQDIEVVTTLDADMQYAAENAMEATLKANSTASNVSQGALIALSPDGAVRAMVGGRDYNASQFNRATQAMRQPGSAFKLFPYLAAVERGAQPGDIWVDQPVTIKNWSPSNYTNDYQGPISLQDALARSINTVAVQVNEQVGRENTIRMARRLGVSTPLKPHASMALGTNEMNLMELTTAYAHLASGGRRVQPFGILEIRTSAASSLLGKSEQLYKRLSGARNPVLTKQTVRAMHQMLGHTVTNGSGRAARLSRHPAAGKTGTSQDHRDAWFVGYTANLVTGIWLGNDRNQPMSRVSGGTLPARTWNSFMSRVLGDEPVQALESTLGGSGEKEILPWQPKSQNLWDMFFDEQTGEQDELGNPRAPDSLPRGRKPADANAPPLKDSMPTRFGKEVESLLNIDIDEVEVEYEYPKPRRN